MGKNVLPTATTPYCSSDTKCPPSEYSEIPKKICIYKFVDLMYATSL